MSGRESYEASQASSLSNMRFAFSVDGTTIYTPMVPPISSSPSPTPTYQPGNAGSGGDNSAAVVAQLGINTSTGGDVIKRKRGRPRKYAPDGSMPSATLTSPPPPLAVQSSGFASPTTAVPTAALSSGKKSRGRPPGSGNKQQLAASELAGAGFTPHIITVKAGEDVLEKLMSFSQNNTRALCILSANGAISNVTLRQAATSGGTVTYEGRFEILSLSGSFILSGNGGRRSKTGGLSVSLAGPDGCVLGGGVAGLLTAASPVQVIVGSFIAAGQKQSKSSGQAEVVTAPTNLVSGTSGGGSLSESFGGSGSPLNQQSNNSNPQGMANMTWR